MISREKHHDTNTEAEEETIERYGKGSANRKVLMNHDFNMEQNYLCFEAVFGLVNAIFQCESGKLHREKRPKVRTLV